MSLRELLQEAYRAGFEDAYTDFTADVGSEDWKKRSNERIDEILPPLCYIHKKRGTAYRLLFTGKLQLDGPYDMKEIAIYMGSDEEMWGRLLSEFQDGRFVFRVVSE